MDTLPVCPGYSVDAKENKRTIRGPPVLPLPIIWGVGGAVGPPAIEVVCGDDSRSHCKKLLDCWLLAAQLLSPKNDRAPPERPQPMKISRVDI